MMTNQLGKVYTGRLHRRRRRKRKRRMRRKKRRRRRKRREWKRKEKRDSLNQDAIVAGCNELVCKSSEFLKHFLVHSRLLQK